MCKNDIDICIYIVSIIPFLPQTSTNPIQSMDSLSFKHSANGVSPWNIDLYKNLLAMKNLLKEALHYDNQVQSCPNLSLLLPLIIEI